MGAAIGPSYGPKISKQATMIGNQAAMIIQASGDDMQASGDTYMPPPHMSLVDITGKCDVYHCAVCWKEENTMRVIDVIRAMHSDPFPDKQCEFGGYTLHMHTNGKVTLKGPNLSEVEVFISADMDDGSIDFFIRNVPPTPANLLLTISYGQEVGGRIE
jgi:hypothetical protein